MLYETKTRFVLFRHGETDWNSSGIVQGLSDIPLNGTGLNQAKDLGQKLASKNLAHIFSSDLSRALQTAWIVAEFCACPVSVQRFLREQNFGVAEGRSTKSIRSEYADKFSIIDDLTRIDANTTSLPSAESRCDVFNRVSSHLKDIGNKFCGRQIGISTHGGVISSVMVIAFGKDIKLGNAEYLIIDYENSQFSNYEIS